MLALRQSGETASLGVRGKVAAAVIFSVNPANSGKIICSGAEYPTNIYLYVDAGTNYIARPNKDFVFNTWVEREGIVFHLE